MLKVNFRKLSTFNSAENKSFTNLIIALKSGISNLIKFIEELTYNKEYDKILRVINEYKNG